MHKPARVSPGSTTCSSAGASDGASDEAKEDVDITDVVDATDDSLGESELWRAPWPPLVRPASARPRGRRRVVDSVTSSAEGKI